MFSFYFHSYALAVGVIARNHGVKFVGIFSLFPCAILKRGDILIIVYSSLQMLCNKMSASVFVRCIAVNRYCGCLQEIKDSTKIECANVKEAGGGEGARTSG